MWLSSHYPDFVEFRSLSGVSTLVVKVFLSTSTPRILAFAEQPNGRTCPISLFLDEILNLVREAYRVSGKDAVGMSTLRLDPLREDQGVLSERSSVYETCTDRSKEQVPGSGSGRV